MRPWNPHTKFTGLPGIEPRLLRQTVPVGAQCVSANWATEAGSMRLLIPKTTLLDVNGQKSDRALYKVWHIAAKLSHETNLAITKLSLFLIHNTSYLPICLPAGNCHRYTMVYHGNLPVLNLLTASVATNQHFRPCGRNYALDRKMIWHLLELSRRSLSACKVWWDRTTRAGCTAEIGVFFVCHACSACAWGT